MTYSYFPGVEPHLLVWFLAVFILVQLLWRLLRFITGAVGKAFSSWIEKLVEAFMRTVLPDPEKTGEQLGSWVLSRLGTKRK